MPNSRNVAPHPSELPALLRDAAAKLPSVVPEPSVLLEAAAEIEGGEDAFGALVEENRRLREKLSRLEKNHAMLVDMFPRRPDT